jgi:capsular polysaccharide biosynthesis protein
MLSNQDQISDTVAFTQFIKKNLRLLSFCGLIGAILGLALGFILPKEYRSKANVYPPSSPSTEAIIDNPNFGYDVEADRLIQIFQSNGVRDSVIKKFDLLKYYELEKSDAEWLDKLTRYYKRDFSFERSTSMSVILTAQTKDPELSAGIVNYMIEVADLIREDIYKQNIRIARNNALSDFEMQKSKTDSALKQLVWLLKENGLNSMALLASNAQISLDLEKLSSGSRDVNFEIGAGIIAFKTLRDRLNEFESRLIRVDKALSNPIPKLYVIDKAEARYKKVFPSKFLLSLTGLIAGVVITAIVIFARKTLG